MRYAHLYHVRVHVTVNTLVKPGEMQELRAALGEIAASGADAAIVQTWAWLPSSGGNFPHLPCMPLRKWRFATPKVRAWRVSWAFPRGAGPRMRPGGRA